MSHHKVQNDARTLQGILRFHWTAWIFSRLALWFPVNMCLLSLFDSVILYRVIGILFHLTSWLDFRQRGSPGFTSGPPALLFLD